MTDVTRSTWPAATTSVTASEAKERQTSTKLEDGQRFRGQSLLLPHCDKVRTLQRSWITLAVFIIVSVIVVIGVVINVVFHIIFCRNVNTLRSGLSHRKSACNVRAPYLGGWNFPQYFFAILYLNRSLTSMQNFVVPGIVPGEPPPSGALNVRGVLERCHVGVCHVLVSFLFTGELF